ncbi:uncharacterized protein L201_004570 [Kwoniella dendrophila CBS 6074]|uniref:Major facilitator superfamily (MFS) profile domain-containing protein n=1 Tax=Kwoniella dendrophila CBS 6074 TaxID=1295534 RepID=A0AAX4JYJ6_9TREE
MSEIKDEINISATEPGITVDDVAEFPHSEKDGRDLHDYKNEIGGDLYAQAEDIDWSPKEEKRVKIKIDWRVLPCFCIFEGLSYLDKTALNYGKLFGMDKSLHSTGSKYSWFASS